VALGYIGKIAKVNLTEGKVDAEHPKEHFYRRYLGGTGIGAYYLLKEMAAGVDPLSEGNVLVFAASVITGTPGPAIPRYSVVAKSPLTGTIGKSEAGGFWGPALKRGGYDALVITGKAKEPSYLYIENGRLEIRLAKHLWGKSTGESQKMLRDELGKEIRVAQIGPGGENMVRYANICNELAHFNGRNGLGAVMGSKNLKAIVVKGSNKVECHDETRIKEITKFVARGMKDHPQAYGLYLSGTPAGLAGKNAGGNLPTENWTKNVFEDAEKIGGEALEEFFIKRKGCYSCPIRCKRVVKVDQGEFQVDPIYGGPEYETLASLGSNLGIGDIRTLAKANELCNKYTLDTISLGMTLSFAMECFDKGLLTTEDTDGLELKFGRGDLLLELIEKIAFKKDVGELLSEGSQRLAEKIGPEAMDLLLAVKGQEMPMHDPRVKNGVGLQFALSSCGADHWTAQQDPLFQEAGSLGLEGIKSLGILEPIGPLDLKGPKVRLIYYTHLMTLMYDVLGICVFGAVSRSILPLSMVLDLVKAATGWDTSLWELLKSAERTSNMLRMFNVREGFGRKDDTLPKRLFEPMATGPLAGKNAISEQDFNEAVSLYYQMAGWNEEGIPLPGKVAELDIDWVGEYM